MVKQTPLTPTLARAPINAVPLTSLSQPQRSLIWALLQADKAATLRRANQRAATRPPGRGSCH